MLKQAQSPLLLLINLHAASQQVVEEPGADCIEWETVEDAADRVAANLKSSGDPYVERVGCCGASALAERLPFGGGGNGDGLEVD